MNEQRLINRETEMIETFKNFFSFVCVGFFFPLSTLLLKHPDVEIILWMIIMQGIGPVLFSKKPPRIVLSIRHVVKCIKHICTLPEAV